MPVGRCQDAALRLYEEGPPRWHALRVTVGATKQTPAMLYAGLDLSRKRLDVCLLDESGARVEVTAAPPDADGLRSLADRLADYDEPIYAAIESMNGARFVHDALEACGWDVALADAQKVKGLAPLTAKTDRIDALVLAELARRDLTAGHLATDPRGTR